MKQKGLLIPAGLPEKAAVGQIMKCNELTHKFGLSLSAEEAEMVSLARQESLVRSGRVEFWDGTGGAMEALIRAFCDSPYIVKAEYADTLCALSRIFYDFKTDSEDEVDDAEAIALMRRYFDMGGGSLELLEGRMEVAARNVRYGRDPEDSGEYSEEDDEEAEDE